MNTRDILNIRQHNQLLAGTTLQEPHEIVSYMGAMQAQAFEMAKWGIGVRLKGATIKDVEDAMNAGKIIRTHILRPTWHLVAAADIHWMSELSAPRIRPIFMGYGKMLGIDKGLFTSAICMVEKLLENGNHLTRQEIGAVLIAEGIVANQDVSNYIMGLAEIDGIVCNGRLNGNKPTYALMHECSQKRIPLQGGIFGTACTTVLYKSWSRYIAGFCLVVGNDTHGCKEGRRTDKTRFYLRRNKRAGFLDEK